MRIVTRAEWRARPPKSPPAIVPISARKALCVHHDGDHPINVGTLPEACELMRKDQAFHQNTRGWADIGYNMLVISAPGRSVDGAILNGRGRDVVGAHCAGFNQAWIGVQVAIGGGQTPSPAALASVRWLYDTFSKAAGHPLRMVGHCDGFATACPGPILLGWVRAGMPVPTTSRPPGKPIPVTVPTTPPAPKPAPPDPFQEDSMRDLIEAAYRKLIGRTPADPEVDHWLVLAATNGWSAKDVVTKIGGTPEAKAHAGKK